MSRPRKAAPSMYWLESGQCWCVDIARKRTRLGKDKDAAQAAYERLVGEMQPRCPPTIGDLVAAYLAHAVPYYSTHGQENGMTGRIQASTGVLRRLHGSAAAASFGPLALRKCLEEFVRRGHKRNSCNAMLGVLKRLFRWAVAEELVAEETYRRLAAVPGLRKGHTAAPESVPVPPAPDNDVAAAVAASGRVLAAMIQLQELTGMRPCEVSP